MAAVSLWRDVDVLFMAPELLLAWPITAIAAACRITGPGESLFGACTVQIARPVADTQVAVTSLRRKRAGQAAEPSVSDPTQGEAAIQDKQATQHPMATYCPEAQLGATASTRVVSVSATKAFVWRQALLIETYGRQRQRFHGMVRMLGKAGMRGAA